MLTWWNNEVARREKQLNSMGWFRRLITNTRELKRQLELKRDSETKSKEEYDRNTWQYLYMRRLRVREEETLATGRARITLIEEAWKGACVNENALIDLKIALTEICSDVSRLEACVRSPSIAFGRLDFLKCVLQLLESESMSRVGAYTDIQSAKRGITSSFQERLEAWEWEEVQRPYGYPFDDLDDIDDIDLIGSSKIEAIRSAEGVQDVQVISNSWVRGAESLCKCPFCVN